ncbi:TetR/AcrR family transcriptional regulator [Succinivibrio sp.]|uniref:TetR/AcrR family transcriptional regulator n=1 Tax=Succinivibrio sp. TaxID=2053619 RepID=UPI003865570B
MARRKKEEPTVHRQAIANAANELFSSKGIDNTSMNEIAKLAGYSKATLYVYFADKEQLVSYLVLRSMNTLYEIISVQMQNKEKSVEERFFSLCMALYNYQQQYPFYFALTQKEIRVVGDLSDFTGEEKECYEVGKKINALIYDYLKEGKEKKIFKQDLKDFSTVFAMWAMISGIISITANKRNYIELSSQESIDTFLNYSFSLVYKSLLT